MAIRPAGRPPPPVSTTATTPATPAARPADDFDNTRTGRAFTAADAFDLKTALAAPGVTDSVALTADLSSARAQLAPMFVIADTVDPSRDPPNALTPAQFDQVVATFSAVRMGNGDLRIGPPTGDGIDPNETATFKQRVMTDLSAILQTRSGRELLDSLVHQPKGHRTVIMDLGDGKARMVSPHASGFEANDLETGTNFHNGVGVPATVVHYRPDRYGPNRSDDLLFHELVHAQGQITGTQASSAPVTDADGKLPGDEGIAQEEYRTTGLGRFASGAITENAYRAERRAIGASGAGALVGDADLVARESYGDLAQSPTLTARFSTAQGVEPQKETVEWFAWSARGTQSFSGDLLESAETADTIARLVPGEAAAQQAKAAGLREAASEKAALENADDIILVKK